MPLTPPSIFLWGCRRFHVCLCVFLVLTANYGLGRSNWISDQSIPTVHGRPELPQQSLGGISLLSIQSREDDLSNDAQETDGPTGSPTSNAADVDTPQLQGRIGKCEDVVHEFKRDFDANRKRILDLLDNIKKEEYLENHSCLKAIVHTAAPVFLNPPELLMVKSSVDLYFGAVWMWDKVARILLQNPEAPSISKRFWSGVPPPVEVGDVVKVLEDGSTIVQSGEYTVVGVQGDECSVEKDGERMNIPRDRLILTIREKYRYIADAVLKNQLENLNEEDPNLLADMEEIFELAGLREAFEKTMQTGDPRYLQTAMKSSEMFHFLWFVEAMRRLPGIQASPIEKPGKGQYKPDPAELSDIYTSDSAIKAFEILQLIRGYTALEGCKPLTHRNLYGSGSDLVSRVIENAKFRAIEVQDEETLHSALENQCRSAVAFVFPDALKSSSLVIPHCVNVWKRMRSDWSQLVLSSDIENDRQALANDCTSKQGQLAPGYMGDCDARCMRAVAQRNYWFDQKYIKRQTIAQDYILAGDVVRLSNFLAADALSYLELLGGQVWRLARISSSTLASKDLAEEAEEISCVADSLTKDAVQPVQGTHRVPGLGLPNPQLLALSVATDLRHNTSIAGANLQSSKKNRKLARGSKAFSAFFSLLSCHVSDDTDTEALCKVFGPFASLAIRIALFLRVEVEEHANKGWTEAVAAFSGKSPGRKLYEKAVKQMTVNARKFIEKFMGGFGFKATGKVEKVKKRIRNILRRSGRKDSANVVHHRVGHEFAKLILFMWANGSQHQVDLAPSKIEEAFRLARVYQTLMILNHGADPIRAITENIKAGCKNTSTMRHKYWPLLDKGNVKISKIADEFGLGLLYGFTTGKTYSALSEYGRALVYACKGKSQLDLLSQGTKYREMMELYQCIELRALGVRLLRIALKDVKAPPADVTGRLFSFLSTIRAIRKGGAKALYKTYLQWVKEGETSHQINSWNDNIEHFECSWHSSQEEQNHMLAEAGKLNELGTSAEEPASLELQACHGNQHAQLNPGSLSITSEEWHEQASSRTHSELLQCAIHCVAANSNGTLDLQQAQANTPSDEIIYSTFL